MVKECAGLLLTLLVIADPGCFGQDDHGESLPNEDIVLVRYIFDFVLNSSQSISATLVGISAWAKTIRAQIS